MKPKCKYRLRLSIGKGSDGIYHYKSFTGYGDTPAKAKKEAERLSMEYQVLHKGELKSPSMTLSEASKLYIESKENVLSPSTIRGYDNIARNHLKRIMELDINELTQIDIQVAINEEAARINPKSVRNVSGFLSAVLEMFRPDFKYHVTLPQKIKHEIEVPDNDQVTEILQSVKEKDPEMFKAIILAAFGSLRRSEICALTVDDIVDGRVIVDKAMVPNKKHQFVVKPTPKTDKSNRAVKMPPESLPFLVSSDGVRIVSISPASVTSRFKAIAKRVNLEGFTFHGLRHYQASILHAMGVPDLYIMQRGGWSTDATLKRVYQHTISKEQEKAEDKICDYFDDKFGSVL